MAISSYHCDSHHIVVMAIISSYHCDSHYIAILEGHDNQYPHYYQKKIIIVMAIKNIAVDLNTVNHDITIHEQLTVA